MSKLSDRRQWRPKIFAPPPYKPAGENNPRLVGISVTLAKDGSVELVVFLYREV